MTAPTSAEPTTTPTSQEADSVPMASPRSRSGVRSTSSATMVG